MRTRMYGGVRGRKTKVGGKPTFVFLLLDYYNSTVVTGIAACNDGIYHEPLTGLGNSQRSVFVCIPDVLELEGDHAEKESEDDQADTGKDEDCCDSDAERVGQDEYGQQKQKNTAADHCRAS